MSEADIQQRASVLNARGCVASLRGDLDAALELHQRALALLDAFERPASGELPRRVEHALQCVLSNLGKLCVERGELDRARAYLERAVESTARLWGPDHPQVAVALRRFGEVTLEAGDPDDARELFRRALKLWSPISDHGSELVSLHWLLGIAARRLAEIDEAAWHLEQALDGCAQLLGPDAAGLAPILDELGAVEHDRGQLDRSLTQLERSLAIRAGHQGPDHLDLVVTLMQLGKTARAISEPEDGLVHFERALEILDTQLGPGDLRTADAAALVGLVHIELDRTCEAVTMLEQAIAVFEAKSAPPMALAHAYFGLGRALWDSADRRMRDRSAELFSRAYGSASAAGDAGTELLAEIEEEWRARAHLDG